MSAAPQSGPSGASYLRRLTTLTLCGLAAAGQALAAAEPPRFTVPSPDDRPLVLVVYGDTRFTQREDVVNAVARRALVGKIATENPAAILIGGDLVYEGHDPGDYRTFRTETGAWSEAHIPVFPALGNQDRKSVV